MVMARDRLSACLFLFVMEALSRLVERGCGRSFVPRVSVGAEEGLPFLTC